MSTDFQSLRRERFLNEEPYAALVKNFRAQIEECREFLASLGPTIDMDDGRHVDWRWGIASNGLQLLIGQYSAGVSVASLAGSISKVVSEIEASALPNAYRTEPFYLDELDTYCYAMWLLSLCKLLRLDPLLPRVIALFDVAKEDNRGKDALFEALVERLGGTPVEVNPRGTMLRNLKAHPLLLQAIEARPEKRPLLVTEFLKAWYPKMKGTYWWGRHDKAPQNFFGYWAFEAGLVTYLWDIDDKSYRDLPFYPKDLVDYARSHPAVDAAALAGTVSSSDQATTRCEAGQPCPREGWWSTPAKQGSRRLFKHGEVMPSVSGDYGATIWQMDVSQD